MEVRRINPTTSELYHHGIKGQRWGIRRYQNPDGSLTPLGQKRFGTVQGFEKAQAKKKKVFRTLGTGVGIAAGIATGTALASKKMNSEAINWDSFANMQRYRGAVGGGVSQRAVANDYRRKASNIQAAGVLAAAGALAVSTFIASGGATEMKRVVNIAKGKKYSDQAIRNIHDEKIRNIK